MSMSITVLMPLNITKMEKDRSHRFHLKSTFLVLGQSLDRLSNDDNLVDEGNKLQKRYDVGSHSLVGLGNVRDVSSEEVNVDFCFHITHEQWVLGKNDIHKPQRYFCVP